MITPMSANRPFLVLLLLLASQTLSSCGKSRVPERIVLITLDTLRYDSLISSMPNTQKMAKEGLSFEKAYSSSSSTQPTHASLFTGLHPWQHAVTANGMILTDNYLTLTESLLDEGFETRAVVASFPLDRKFGFARGFEAYDDDFTESGPANTWNEHEVENQNFHSFARGITDKAINSIDEASNDQQFFWFHYYDPHAPYGDAAREETGMEEIGLPKLLKLAVKNPPAQELDAKILEVKEAYLRDVRFLDKQLARLFDRLGKDKTKWKTTIVITADHGESFGEDGSFGHGRRVSAPQLHIPLILHGPGISPGIRKDIAGSVDVHKTLHALARVAGKYPGKGRDLLAEDTRPPVAFGMRRTFLEPGKDLQKIDGKWQEVKLGGNRFFRVDQNNLYSGNKEDVRNEDSRAENVALPLQGDLKAIFSIFEDELNGVKSSRVMDEDTRRKLKEMGYVE